MQLLKRNPLPHSPLLWLMLLAVLWACLGVPHLGQKAASGQIYGWQAVSWDATPLQAAPRLGFGGLAGESVSAPPVGANGGTVAKPLFGNLYPEHVIDPAKIVPTERLSGISGNFNYVITEQGTLIVGRSGHTSLTGGAPVQAAGELQLYNGNVKWIDNASGHYQPSSNIGSVAETAFNNAGLDATGKFVPKVWVPNPTLPRGGSWVKTN
jgi:hypothetical protein